MAVSPKGRPRRPSSLRMQASTGSAVTESAAPTNTQSGRKEAWRGAGTATSRRGTRPAAARNGGTEVELEADQEEEEQQPEAGHGVERGAAPRREEGSRLEDVGDNPRLAQGPEREREQEDEGHVHGPSSGSANSSGFSPCHTPSDAIFFTAMLVLPRTQARLLLPCG
uniref:Uncharacterized protein n=1 Tax=Oryza brachyantha TaxID=4533 RepID=J3M6P0_ORYBR